MISARRQDTGWHRRTAGGLGLVGAQAVGGINTISVVVPSIG
jgi:hypothetical protein